MRVLIGALLVALMSSVVHATEAQDKKARELFMEGQAQFNQDHYQAAYDLFKQAYLLSPLPAMRYNMASALQGLGRPHDAAEELRAYLRVKPDDPNRANLEERIRGLDEAQALLDAEKKPAPAPVPALVPVAAAPAAQVRDDKPKKKTLIIVLSTVGAVVVAGGLGIGLGLGLHDWHTASTLGTKQATQ